MPYYMVRGTHTRVHNAKKRAKIQKNFDICKFFLHICFFFCNFAAEIMKKDSDSRLITMYRRWSYMVLAIIAAAVLINKPIFRFQSDKGIIYVRSFSMDEKNFVVTQTELATGLEEVTEVMSVKWLYYCNKLMLWTSILCFLCFFSFRGRLVLADLTMILAGAYYVLVLYYAMKISDWHYATLYPNWAVFLPAVVLQCMVLTHRNVVVSARSFNSDEEQAD